jgi:hypothetical protein
MMTFHNRRGIITFWEKTVLSASCGRGTKLLFMALAAMGVALFLSLSTTSVWAGYQTPTSPVSPVPTQTDQPPTPSPTVLVNTPTPSAGTPGPSQPFEEGERGTALLVAGGIVLAGLIVGAVVFFLEGVMSS